MRPRAGSASTRRRGGTDLRSGKMVVRKDQAERGALPIPGHQLGVACLSRLSRGDGELGDSQDTGLLWARFHFRALCRCFYRSHFHFPLLTLGGLKSPAEEYGSNVTVLSFPAPSRWGEGGEVSRDSRVSELRPYSKYFSRNGVTQLA